MSRNKVITRRKFLQIGGIATVGLLTPRYLSGLGCDPTTPDFLGPFWEEDAPYRTVLASSNEPGYRLIIFGKVTANDCQTPIPNTIVDVWHANDSGCYGISENCETGNPEDDEYNLRGRVISGLNGEYVFETIKPGFYAVGPDIYRPSHIHFMITPIAGDSIITQLYFEGDDYIDTDPGSSNPNAINRIIPLQETESGLLGVFNIILDIDPSDKMINGFYPVGPARLSNYHNRLLPEGLRLFPPYPNPFNSSTNIKIELDRSTTVLLSVFDLKGQWVNTLVKGRLHSGEHSIHWDGKNSSGIEVPTGEYIVILQTPAGRKVSKLTILR
ncbi:MAG TPA: T9SS type A sorting domain-containing protein [Candidatus Marinimicrobia bacterium]|nr:T9SS type A sorting domain-containing protein [Candidatus Neomarinimicrobiota bacterium]